MATILKGYRCVTTVAAVCYVKIYLIVLVQYSPLLLESVIAAGGGGGESSENICIRGVKFIYIYDKFD